MRLHKHAIAANEMIPKLLVINTKNKPFKRTNRDKKLPAAANFAERVQTTLQTSCTKRISVDPINSRSIASSSRTNLVSSEDQLSSLKSH